MSKKTEIYQNGFLEENLVENSELYQDWKEKERQRGGGKLRTKGNNRRIGRKYSEDEFAE